MIDNFYKKIQENLNSKEIFYKNYDEEYSYQDLKIYCKITKYF